MNKHSFLPRILPVNYCMIVHIVPKLRTTEYGVGILWDQGDLLSKQSIEIELKKVNIEAERREALLLDRFPNLLSRNLALYTIMKSAFDNGNFSRYRYMMETFGLQSLSITPNSFTRLTTVTAFSLMLSALQGKGLHKKSMCMLFRQKYRFLPSFIASMKDHFSVRCVKLNYRVFA